MTRERNGPRKTVVELAAAIFRALPPVPPPDSNCHRGICSQKECAHCKRVKAAYNALNELKRRCTEGGK